MTNKKDLSERDICTQVILAIIDDLEKQVAERKGQSEMLMQAVLSEAFAG